MLRNQEQRIAPLHPPYDDETAALVDSLGGPLAIFRVLARRPDRATGVLGWGQYYLSKRSALSLRHRELVIDRTTALCGSEYEWGVHIGFFAEKVRLAPEQVAATVLGGPDDDCWTDPSDRAVLHAVDALVRDHDLDDQTWTRLVEAVGEEGALDLLLLCGWYHAISFLTRVTRLAPEAGMPLFPESR